MAGRGVSASIASLIGFLIASAMAIPIGVLIGCFRVWEAAIEPLVDFVRYMPVVAFVPLTILWAGTGDSQKFLIIWIGTFFQQVLMVMDNVKRVPATSSVSAAPWGCPERKIFIRIVRALGAAWHLGHTAHQLWAGPGHGWCWRSWWRRPPGLGYRITVSQRYFQTDTIIGYILLLGIFGLVTDQAMKAMERCCSAMRRGHRWRRSSRSAASTNPSAKAPSAVAGAARHRSQPGRQRVRVPGRDFGLRQEHVAFDRRGAAGFRSTASCWWMAAR